MANLRFYFLDKSPEPQAIYACRLAQKLLQTGQRVGWYHPDPLVLQQLDDLLWQFSASSFLPHGIAQPDAAIDLSTTLPALASQRVVFNFAESAILPATQFAQIIEIVENVEAAKMIGREKFKAYREANVTSKIFKV